LPPASSERLEGATPTTTISKIVGTFSCSGCSGLGAQPHVAPPTIGYVAGLAACTVITTVSPRRSPWGPRFVEIPSVDASSKPSPHSYRAPAWSSTPTSPPSRARLPTISSPPSQPDDDHDTYSLTSLPPMGSMRSRLMTAAKSSARSRPALRRLVASLRLPRAAPHRDPPPERSSPGIPPGAPYFSGRDRPHEG
jgi:hypothetical protein